MSPRKTDTTTGFSKPKPQTNADSNGTEVGRRAAELRVDSPDGYSTAVEANGTDDHGEIAPGNSEGRRKRRRVASTRQRESIASQTGVMSPDSDLMMNSKRLRDKGSRQSDLPEAKLATAADPPGAKRARAASSVTAYVERHYAKLGIPWMVPPERSPSPDPDPVDPTGCDGGGGARLESSGGAYLGAPVGGTPTIVEEAAVGLTRSNMEDGRKESGINTVAMEEQGIEQEPLQPARNSLLTDILAGRLVVGQGRVELVDSGSGDGGGDGGEDGAGIGTAHEPKQGGHRHMDLHEQQHKQLKQHLQYENYKQLQRREQSQGQARTGYGTALSQLSPSTLGCVAPAPQLHSQGPYPVSSVGSSLPPHSSVQTHNSIPLTASIQDVGKHAKGAEYGDQEQHPAREAVAGSNAGGTQVCRAPLPSTIVVAAKMAWNSHDQTPAAGRGMSAPPTVDSETQMVNLETHDTQASEVP